MYVKRLILLSCLFFSIFCYSTNLSSCFEELFKQPYTYEGFCADTLVKTSCGYKFIQEIIVGDSVVTCDNQQKFVVSVLIKSVESYVRLIINDVVVCTGCDQQYYVLPNYEWVLAKNIKKGDVLLSSGHEGYKVTDVALIKNHAFIYGLTVEDNLFAIISYDLCVHNTAAVLFGAGISLGNILAINPITATIGATMALATIAYRALHEYQQNCNFEISVLPQHVVLAERTYYGERKAALEKIKQELSQIKDDLLRIKTCQANATTFTYQFLYQNKINVPNQNLFLNISVATEMQLTEEHKVDLRKCRELVLAGLEQDVIVLQLTLGFHMSELIEQTKSAYKEYEHAQKQVTSKELSLWEKNFRNMTDDIALRTYNAVLREEYLLHNLKQKIDDLKSVAHYYRNCMNSACIEQSTNIIECLSTITPLLDQYEQLFAKEKGRIAHNMSIVEKYFVSKNRSIIRLKNDTLSAFKKGDNARNKQAVMNAHNKLSNICGSGGPYKDPKKDDENKDEEDYVKIEIYEKNAQHIFRNEIGHLPDTPANRKLLIDIASDKRNFLGKCKYGNSWYSKNLENGQQVWVSVRKGFIRNGGLNNVIRNFNFETGLSKMKG